MKGDVVVRNGALVVNLGSFFGKSSLWTAELVNFTGGNPKLAKVAFRNSCGKYLSVSPYGNEWKTKVLGILISDRNIRLPVDVIELILDLSLSSTTEVGPDSHTTGFTYEPGKVQDQRGFTEIFQVEQSSDNRYVGISTLWGSYLRSPSWSNKILQSPHLAGDEMFTLKKDST